MDGGALDADARRPNELSGMEIAPGVTLSGRYRVQQLAWSSGGASVWVAHDAVLDRPVFIRTVPGADAESVGRVVARTAQVTHPGLCQIYDVSADPPAIVFEHAPGGRLADRKDGALAAPEAARLVCQIAAAVAALHEHGMAHGAISPSTVLFDEEGRPKLTIAGAGEPLGDDESGDDYRPAGEADPHDRDRYALAAVAYRLFTGRDPGPDAPPARSAKRGVPPAVDALLSRGLARDEAHRPGPEEFRRVLEPIAAAEPHERGPGFFRQEAQWLVPVLLVLGLGAAAIVIGVTNTVTRSPGKRPSPTPTSVAYRIVDVDDFDPEGNGEEHPKQTAFVTDGTDKGWSTVGYSRVTLDGRKAGVGLVFDLGSPRPVGRILVRTSLPGWEAEWRTADAKGTTADDYQVVTSFEAKGGAVMISPTKTAQYWLLWITRLVDSESGGSVPFQAQVSEVEFAAR